MKTTAATPATAPAFAVLPVETLFVSPCNVRTQDPDHDLDGLVASIRANGVIQPLVVRPAGDDRFEVIAGQRRLLACQRVARERQAPMDVPCLIREGLDEGGAVAVSLAENVERLPMEAFDQCEAFARLLQLGRGIKEIATSFGIPQKVVKQRLALARLIEPIKALARERKLSDEDAQLLALASLEKQHAWWGLRQNPQERAPTGYPLKSWLFGGQAISTKVALFSLNEYPGETVADLFGTERFFQESSQFWTHQNQAVALRKQAYLAEGWADVLVLEDACFEFWKYRPTAREAGGWVMIEVKGDGRVVFHEGYLPVAEIRRRERDERGALDGDLKGETASKPPRGEVTQALLNYLALHKANGVRLALMDDSPLALRVAVASIVGGAQNWNVRADRTRPAQPEIAQSVRRQAGQQAIERRRAAAQARLLSREARQYANRFHNGHLLYGADPDEGRTVALLRTLLESSDEEVLQLLAVAVAETLVAGSAFTELLGQHLKVDLPATWKVDPIFIDLLSDKGALAAICAEWGTAPGRNATGSEFRKTLQNRIDGQGGAPVTGWLPRYLRFPFEGYVPERPAPEVRARHDHLAAILDGSAVYEERHAHCLRALDGGADEEGSDADGEEIGEWVEEDCGLDGEDNFDDGDFSIDVEEVA